MPPATPVTIPVAEPIVATDVVPDTHTPPVTVLARVVLEPAQTEAVPVIVPAYGRLLTVTILVALVVPQLLTVV